MADGDDPPPTRLKNPLWIAPFLGRVPVGVQPQQLSLLGVVALALFFEEYDMAMLGMALPQIAADLNISVEALPDYLWMIRAGALPAFFLLPYADSIGRRPVFIAATALMGLFTFLTAFAQTPIQFMLCQALTRTFFLTGSAVAFVMIAEEYPAEHRGWGMGILSALGAVGHGLAAGLYAAIHVLPFGWRALYAVGIVPLFLIPMFLKKLPETDRFTAHSEGDDAAKTAGLIAALQPIIELARIHPLRAAVVAGAGFLASFGTMPSFQFTSYFAQEQLSWTPQDIMMMVIGAGALGIIGNVVAGRLGDTFGRKPVGFALMSLFPGMSYGFFHSTGWLVGASFAGLVFCSMGGRLMLRALSTELFPTAQRGAAGGLYSVLETLGGVTGLFVLARFAVDETAALAGVLPLLACGMLAAGLTLLALPETKSRELEDLS